MATNVESGIKSVAELIHAARTRANPLLYGTPGVGSGPHLAIELFAIESKMTKAGFFTLALVEGLSGHADIDKDGVIYTQELERYASVRVAQLSKGTQTPITGRPSGIRPFPIATIDQKPLGGVPEKKP